MVNLSIMREEHLAMDCGWNGRHGIGVTTPQKDVVVKRGVDNFNVDTNSLASKGDRIQISQNTPSNISISDFD